MWFQYALSNPVDYFKGCVAFNEYVQRIIDEDGCFCEGDDQLQNKFRLLSEIYSSIYGAMEGFNRKTSGWDGDVISDGLYVFALPSDLGSTMLGFIWKQNDKGSTFVASPVRLQWLDECMV